MAKRIAIKTADELAQVGLRCHRLGDKEQAERSYRAAIERDGRHVGALTLLSTMFMDRADYPGAASLLERALKVAPDVALLHSNLGESWRRLGRYHDALSAFERAVALNPDLAEGHYNRALTLEQLGLKSAAIAAYEAALEQKPELGGAVLHLLTALREAAEYERAVRWCRRLRSQISASAALSCAAGSVFADVFQVDEAIAHFERALELEPERAQAQAELGAALGERGEIERALTHLKKAQELEPESWLYHSNWVYLLQFSDLAAGGAVLEAARAFGRRHADPVTRFVLAAPERGAGKRLRIGYVSPDFREHPVALFMRPVLLEHDRSCVEVFCYSDVRCPDHVTVELKSIADHWRDISLLDDDAAAALVHEDAIDVLVDLTQHAAGNRLLMFARKPAPVQVSWLGYPGPTGVAAIDYRLTDPRLDPPGLGRSDAGEALIWLPETYWCYRPTSDVPLVGELPARRNGHVTFGSLNSFKKVSDRALALWTDVLEAVPGSHLLIVAPAGQARERIRGSCMRRGIDPARLELIDHMQRGDYLETYNRVDICLDAIPYNGGTTTLDAFWMGVPVVTLAGAESVARAGASLAYSVGLPDLVASSEVDYVGRAIELATDMPKLAWLRKSLRDRMKGSRLMDAPRFVEDLEAAYRDAWQRRCHDTSGFNEAASRG